MNAINTQEHAHNLFGIDGRMFNRVVATNGLYLHQTFGASRPFNEPGYKKGSTISIQMRFDDNCRNGAMSFAMTGSVKEPGARDSSMAGCIHGELAKYFPEVAHLIKWHLTDTRYPLHYAANAIYHASNQDHSGYAAGEPCQWDTKLKFGDFPISFKVGRKFREWLFAALNFNRTAAKANPDYVRFEPVAVEHEKTSGDTYTFDPKYTFNGFAAKWHECPFDTLEEAQEFAAALGKYELREVKIVTAYSKGKERNLPAARNAAVWPDATDAELCAPRAELEAMLNARLPAMMEEFRAAMDSCGFAWVDAAPNARG